MNLPNEGIHFIAAQYEGCSQKSKEEAEIINSMYRGLLKQHFKNDTDPPRLLTVNDILVVTPYNVQANYLRSVLPEGARVGTVDKFQGQEAPIVFVSMVTSSSEDLPRGIEFLLSPNRLNVAISRAQWACFILHSPHLAVMEPSTPNGMVMLGKFVTLCKS